MVSRAVLVATVIIVVLAVGSGWYAMQQPFAPAPTPTPTTTPTETPTPTPSPTPTPPPTESPEEQAVKEVVQAYFDAINRHSPHDVASLFTINGTYTHFSSNKPNMVGRDEIERGYTQFFQEDPTVSIKILNITVVNISTDTARVECERTRLGKYRDIAPPSYTYTFDMIKEDDSWKITAVTSSIHAEIVIPRLSNIVHIDGKWTTSDEWSDALEVPMEYNGYDPCPNNGTTYIRIKHDGSYLYVLVDYISDSTPRSPPRGNWWEGVEVYFDPEQNGGWTPQPDDYLYNFCVEPAQQWKAKVKTTDGKWDWAHQYTSEEIQKLMAFSSDATNDPYTTNKHVIYELKIPLPDKKEFGLFIDATDHGAKSFMTWPGKVWNEIPQAWGILKLSQ